MVTQVSFGNFSSINGKNVLTGVGGSGINTQALIASLAQVRGAQATQDQTEITANNAQSSALNQFQQLLSNFQSAADALSNPPGVGNAANNAFQFTTGSVSSNGSGYLTISTQPGAALQSYTINDITQLAAAATQSTGIFTLASADTAAVSANPIVGSTYQFAPGTFTLNGQSITLNEGDSLNTVAADFNAVSTNTGVNATVIQISSTQYELQFNATKTGAANGFDLSSPSSVTDASGVLNNIGLTEQQSTGTLTIAGTGSTIVSASPIAGTAHQFAPGTLTFAGSGATVTLAEGDSLSTVATKFNAVTAQTGISAHIIEPSSGNFKLVFTATTGSGSFDMTSSATVSDPSGALTGAALGATQAGNAATAGKDAQFRINGLSIDRASNNISDVISGVTINLQQVTAANADITVSVNPDTTTVQNAIVNFVNSYNAIKSFAAQQTQLNSDGTYASTAILAGNTTFRSIMADITQTVTAQVAGLSGLNSLASVGITLTTQPATTGTNATPQVDNILTVNDGELSSALATNFQGVSNLFGFNLTSNNANLGVFTATNLLGANSFTLNIDPGTSTFTADIGGGNPLITLQATAISGGTGYLLTGPAGSALAGLQLIYASSSAATIAVTATQGIADQMYNTTNAATTANTGTLAVALTALQTSNTNLNSDIARVNAQVAQYQTQLLQQFAALEQVVSNVNNLLGALAANDQARYTAALTA
ncbi:MAG: flagellar filament capping protein FliD [Pseudomonadota bacterium]|nr:flagellar filament capping protein FliD [Pseudomonadota bacterium]MDE3037460.1 flagellar filament capping protein FliD [Pseudomonadota bacterium]